MEWSDIHEADSLSAAVKQMEEDKRAALVVAMECGRESVPIIVGMVSSYDSKTPQDVYETLQNIRGISELAEYIHSNIDKDILMYVASVYTANAQEERRQKIIT